MKLRTSSSSSTQLSLNKGPEMMRFAMSSFGSLWRGLLLCSGECVGGGVEVSKECARCNVHFTPLSERCCDAPKVNRLRFALRRAAAPRFAPEPLLRQREDRDLMLRIVRQVLVQVRERVRIATELVVGPAQHVSDTTLAKDVEINDVKRTDVVRLPLQVLFPVPLLPELKPNRLGVCFAHWRIAIPARGDGRREGEKSECERWVQWW